MASSTDVRPSAVRRNVRWGYLAADPPKRLTFRVLTGMVRDAVERGQANPDGDVELIVAAVVSRALDDLVVG